MSDRIEAHFRELIDAVRDKIHNAISDQKSIIEPLILVDTTLASLEGDIRKPNPERLPACKHLPEILAIAKQTNMGSLASAFEKLEPNLKWIQNPNYSDELLGAGYLDNFAYCDFIGPRGLTGGDYFAAGFLLLGPHFLYPNHNHAASEVYFVVGGTADWRQNDFEWDEKLPGSFIFHSPWTVHATRCKHEPLLALYFWFGNINQPAKLVDEYLN